MKKKSYSLIFTKKRKIIERRLLKRAGTQLSNFFISASMRHLGAKE